VWRRTKGFNVIDLTAKETALFAESVRAMEEMPDVNSVELPDAAQNVTIAATEEERRQLWEKVKPQIRLADNLNTPQREQMMALLEKHAMVFSKDPTDLGLVRGFYHHVNTGEAKPVKCSRTGRVLRRGPRSTNKSNQWRRVAW
jgi:hypothetical protein